MATRAPVAKDCEGCSSEDCGLEPAAFAISRFRTPSIPAFVRRFGISARSGAERTPRELRGPILRLFLGPC
eukprot:15438930-Alexandrium_andersonii.AAC.1